MNKSTTATFHSGCNIVFRAALMAMSLVSICGLSAAAQGLAGAPPDCVRYGSDEGMLYYSSCDTAISISRTITLIALLTVMFVPLAEKKKANLRLVALELVGLAFIPISVHLIGIWAINNFGGIGGGF